jgi:hypothetical protein
VGSWLLTVVYFRRLVKKNQPKAAAAAGCFRQRGEANVRRLDKGFPAFLPLPLPFLGFSFLNSGTSLLCRPNFGGCLLLGGNVVVFMHFSPFFGRVLPQRASSYSRTPLIESQGDSLEVADEELVGAAALFPRAVGCAVT